jgi:hypothetical protein
MWLSLLLFCAPSFAGDFTVSTPGSAVRGNLWLGEGPATVAASGATYVANRFQLGAELHLLTDYRLLLGWTLVDEISSAESATLVGQVSRTSTDLSAGYFVVPDRLWLQYSFVASSVHGSEVIGYDHAYGHGPALGWRFYDGESMNLALVAGYVHMSAKTISVVDLLTQQNLSATYPSADMFSLTVRIGLDLGGRREIRALGNK